MKRGTSNLKGDPVVIVVLDKLCEITSIDPSSILPDYKLGADLGMGRIEIQQLLASSAEELGLAVPFENCGIEDTTPRMMVAQLKHWAASQGRMAA